MRSYIFFLREILWEILSSELPLFSFCFHPWNSLYLFFEFVYPLHGFYAFFFLGFTLLFKSLHHSVVQSYWKWQRMWWQLPESCLLNRTASVWINAFVGLFPPVSLSFLSRFGFLSLSVFWFIVFFLYFADRHFPLSWHISFCFLVLFFACMLCILNI